MNSGSANLIVAAEPLKPRVVYLKSIAGNNLAGALRCAINNKALQYVDLPRVQVRVNGEIQDKTPEALDRVLCQGDTVHIEVQVRGDNPLRTAFQIFIQIGAAIVGAMYGPWAAAAVQVAGALLTNVLFPPAKPEQFADANDSAALRDQSNSIRRRMPMPMVMGSQRIGFDVAALAYTENVGDESWINVIFGVHYGPCQLANTKIGETLLADYPASDYQIEYFLTPGPRDSQLYKQAKYQENMNNEMDLHGVWEIATLQEGADQGEVDISLPNGLYYTNDKGKRGNEEVAGQIQYAEVGTENWINAGLPAVNDKDGRPMSAGSFYINMKTANAVRKTYIFALPDNTKQYKVRVKAYDYDNRFDETSVWDTYWTALRSTFFKKPIVDETLSCVVLRVKSSGDLNGTLPVVSAEVTPIVPIWNGVDWNTTAPSSNMAACLRWALTGPPAAQPLSADEINISCGTAYELIEENGWDNAAIYVTEEISQEDLMKVCGMAGRFSTYWSGEDLCFVTDWEKPIPRQVFTNRNISGYKYRREFQEELHAVIVEFKNLDNDSGGDEVWVYADGYTKETATKFESLRLQFACPMERAFKEGRVYLTKRLYKTEVHEWVSAFDTVTSTYGDRVRLSHNVTLYGQAAGRVVNRWWNGDHSKVIGIRVDFRAEMEFGTNYSIDARRFDRALIGLTVQYNPTPTRNLYFTVPLDEADAPLKDDVLVFGETNLVTEDVEIDNFERQDANHVRIMASRYIAEEIEQAETGPIPPLVSGLTPKEPTPQVRILSARGAPEGAEIVFDVQETQTNRIRGFIAKWRYRGATWNTLPILGSDARVVRTPPLEAPSFDPEDEEEDKYTKIDVQIITISRRGDYSRPVFVNALTINKGVDEPTGFDAMGLRRNAADGSAYPVLAVIADPILGGDVQYLEVEIETALDPGIWESAGNNLPANNPAGDFNQVKSGELYNVRARWRTQDNWASAWVLKMNVRIPGNSVISSDTSRIGGRVIDEVFAEADLTSENLIREALDRHESVAFVERQVYTNANASESTAQTLDSVVAVFGGTVASVEEFHGATIEANGKMEAVVSLRLSVGGRVSGYTLMNDGTESSFDIEADYFRVWNGTSNVPAFQVSGGQAYVNGNLVRTESMIANAVTEALTYYNATTRTLTNSTPVTMAFLAVKSDGVSRLQISCNFLLTCQGTGPGFNTKIDVVRTLNAVETVVFTATFQPPSGEDYVLGWQPIMITDLPAAHANDYVYDIRVSFPGAASMMQQTASHGFMRIEKVKR